MMLGTTNIKKNNISVNGDNISMPLRILFLEKCLVTQMFSNFPNLVKPWDLLSLSKALKAAPTQVNHWLSPGSRNLWNRHAADFVL